MPEPAATPSSIPGKTVLFRVFFFAVFLFLLYQLGLIFSPFLTALMGAATLALIFSPVNGWFRKKLHGHATLAATLSTVCMLVVVILPILLLTWLVSREAVAMLPAVKESLAGLRDGSTVSLEQSLPAPAREIVARADAYFGSWGLDVHGLVSQGLDVVGTKLQELAKGLVGNVFGLLLHVTVLVIGVFFFFRDGGRMVRGVVDYIPMEVAHKELLVRRLDETFSAVVRGVFITASAQAVLVGIGCALGGLRYAVLLGFATAFMALIPFFGAAGIWVPVALWGALTGNWRAFWCVLAFGLVASVSDNFLKPWIMGGRTQIPTFLLFFGILGGLEVYGFLGVFIGPLMIGLLLTVAKIYREQFHPPPAPAIVGPPPSAPAAPAPARAP
jgi:predicted PurR-regulated permease PerM